jgi:hypothetical protein
MALNIKETVRKNKTLVTQSKHFNSFEVKNIYNFIHNIIKCNSSVKKL